MATETTTLVCLDSVQGQGANAFFDHIRVIDSVNGNYWIHCEGGISSFYFGGVTHPGGIADIDPVLAAGAIGAGIFVLLPVYAAIWGFRQLYEAVKGGS